MPCRSLHILRS